MRSAGPEDFRPRAPREAVQQCLVREANELTERRNGVLDARVVRSTLRCECGDPTCELQVEASHVEYEAVRAYGSHFMVRLNHENPESSWVLSENARFAVVDVVVGDARYHVRARNPRHAWADAHERSR